MIGPLSGDGGEVAQLHGVEEGICGFLNCSSPIFLMLALHLWNYLVLQYLSPSWFCKHIQASSFARFISFWSSKLVFTLPPAFLFPKCHGSCFSSCSVPHYLGIYVFKSKNFFIAALMEGRKIRGMFWICHFYLHMT